MTDIHDENGWSSEFHVTQDDLNEVAEGLEHDRAPQALTEIAQHILQGRMEHDPDNQTKQAEDILLKYGEPILSRLEDALQIDPRFTSLEGKWFLLEKLPRIEHDTLQKVHGFLLQNPSSSVDQISSFLKEDPSTDQTLVKMALHAALGRLPERFENIGTTARPQWNARLPSVEQAEVTHYAYDPQTYEVLCRPGQRLSQKKAQRLQELNLYAGVVTFAE